MFTDYTKMFDPQSFTTQWQKALDMNQAVSNSKKGMEAFKKVSSMWTDAMNTCAEKQMKMCQTAMEDSIECMRELSSVKGVEDFISKQTEMSRKWTEKYQSNAQEIADTFQKTQQQCTDFLSKMINPEWTTKSTSSK